MTVRINDPERSDRRLPVRCAQPVQTRRNAPLAAVLAGVLGLSLFMSTGVHAWGTPGHETVAAMADQLIAGRRAAVEVRKLLKPGETLQSVANWADCAKGHCPELTQEMREFARRNPHHARYHYTDVPFQADAYEEGGVGTSDEDIVHILKQCIAVLKGATDRAANPHDLTPREALLLLVHLLGDVHQPLHVGSAYVSDKNTFVVPASTAAVDNVLIFSTAGDNDLIFESESLHAFWDGQAVEEAMRRVNARTPQEFADQLMRASPDLPIVNGDVTKWPGKWASETLATAKLAHAGLSIETREEAHNNRFGAMHFRWRVSAPSGYAQSAATLAAMQLTRAGYRLAAVLEAVWH
jgi:S1/P1 Nuclease